MKNSNQERLHRLMKQYHRNQIWHWNGIYLPDVYPQHKKLQWFDEVGFILNGRRVMVGWAHPRMKYSSAISELATKEAGDPPMEPKGIFSFSIFEKKWKKLGRSRKKVAFYTLGSSPGSNLEYYSELGAIDSRIRDEGIDFVVRPSISTKRMATCMRINLCIPVDVRNDGEARALVLLARRLIKGETTLSKEFPGYEYGRSDWLAEAESRARDSQKCPVMD